MLKFVQEAMRSEIKLVASSFRMSHVVRPMNCEIRDERCSKYSETDSGTLEGGFEKRRCLQGC